MLHIAFVSVYKGRSINKRHCNIFMLCLLLSTDFAIWFDCFMYSLEGNYLFPGEGQPPICNATAHSQQGRIVDIGNIKDIAEPFMFPFESKLTLILCATLIKHLHKLVHEIEYASFVPERTPLLSDTGSTCTRDTYGEEVQSIDLRDNQGGILKFRPKSKTRRGLRVAFMCIVNVYTAFGLGLFNISCHLILILKYGSVVCVENTETAGDLDDDSTGINRIHALTQLMVQRITYDFLANVALVSLIVIYWRYASERNSLCTPHSGSFVMYFVVFFIYIQHIFVIVADVKRNTFATENLVDTVTNCLQLTLQSFFLAWTSKIKLTISSSVRRLHNYSIQFLCVYNLCMYIIDTFLLYKYFFLRPELYTIYKSCWIIVLNLSIPCAAYYRYHCMVLLLQKLSQY